MSTTMRRQPPDEDRGDQNVIWAYRLLLNREPESADVVRNHPLKNDPYALVRSILQCEEFTGRKSPVHFNRQLVEFGELSDRVLRDYAAGEYNQIGGWGINDFLVRVFLTLNRAQQNFDITGNLFEIGVYQGRVTILLGLMARETERIAVIDIFEGMKSHNIDKSGIGATRKAFDDNLARYGLTERTDIIEGDSLFLKFSDYPALTNIRFAHIDGAHYTDAVVNDLVKTQQIMVPGGIVVMDDYGHNAFSGVHEACDRFMSFATPRLIIPFAVGNNKLFLTTHSHHAEYLAYMRGCMPDRPITRIHAFDAIAITD